MCSTNSVTSFPVASASAPWILQWNCRALATKKAELTHRLNTQGRPIAMLLQEVSGMTVGLPGYDHYINPSITHKPTRAGNTVPVCYGQAAIYIDRLLPRAAIDTTSWCTGGQEIVAVRTQLQNRKYVLVSAYCRPIMPRGTHPEWGWMAHLCQAFPGDTVIIGGDFNAHHPAWGYGRSNPRGEILFQEAQACRLQLLNDLNLNRNLSTRYGQGSRQGDTAPGLTWASRIAVLDWIVSNDPMRSDPLPILIMLAKARCTNTFRRTAKVVKCDHYRELLQEWDTHS